MNAFVKTALALTLIFGSTTAMASYSQYETQTIGGNFTVQDSEVKSIHLPQARHIRNIVVQAQGVRTDSMIEVMVNGETKGTIFAPGRDPSYVVTIGETTSSIQFRHRSGGSMRIMNVTATLSTWAGRPPREGGGWRGSSSQMEDLAYRTLRAVESIRQYSTLDEEATYLLPIKKKAGQVLVMASARGDYSRKTTVALVALQDQIDFAAPFIDVMMEQPGLFHDAVELMSIREHIDDLLD